MKHSLTRLAVALTALYWISGFVLAITSAALEPQSGWLVFAWYQLAEIILLYYVVPLTALLWIGWAIFWLCGGTAWTTPFTVFGLALPLLYYAALQVPNLIERGWHAHQLALARIETIADEPLLTEQGHPIGVRLTYRVSFPAGLSALHQEPPADAPAADLYLPFPHSPLLDFAIRGSTLSQVARGGFSRGVSLVAVDFVPAFSPACLPAAASVSGERSVQPLLSLEERPGAPADARRRGAKTVRRDRSVWALSVAGRAHHRAGLYSF